MQAIALWDTLQVTPRLKSAGLEFTCNIPELTNEQNLVVQAYDAFWQATRLPPLGLHVHLTKTIPSQAGLGGGSSDAAAMLQILNHLSYAHLSTTQLRQIAARLGSDVPFFITGGTALATGRGEVIQPLYLDHPVAYPVVVIKPRDLVISTADAYRAYATRGQYQSVSPEHLLISLKKAVTYPDIEPYLLNDFEKVLFYRYPLLEYMATEMRAAGIQRPLLSGSGSAMVGFLESSPKNRRRILEHFPPDQYEVFWTHTIPHGMIQKASLAHSI